MSADAHLDMLSARVDTLESEVLAGTAAGAVGNDWSAADANGNPSVKDGDPKGRNIWEAQWSEDDNTLWCYVPECALIIDGNEVTVDVENGEDKKGDEIKLSEGVWYLQIFQFGDSASYSATFTVNPKQGDENLKYSIKIISVTKDGTVDNQYAVGAVILNMGADYSSGDEGRQKYFGDVQSISQHSGTNSDSGVETGSVFQLAGFGRYNLKDRGVGGKFFESSEMNIDDIPDENVAFVVRVGNTNKENGNTLQYKTLRVGGRTAFRLVRAGEDSWQVVDCYYNVGGILKLAPSAKLSKDSLRAGCIAAFCLPSQDVRIFKSISSLGDAQKKADEYVVALYVFNADGTVAVDLRNAPQIQYFEEGLI